MTRQKIFWMVLILASACELFAAADPNGWKELNLSSTRIAGATVYYEKLFEPKLPIFEREYKKFLAEKESAKAINAKKSQIFADINQILGISEPDTKMQDKLWTKLLGAFSLEKTTFYIVKQGTIKDLLRVGGQLPNFTYDKASDTAAYNPEFKTTSKNESIKDFEFTFPIDSDETFEKDVSHIFQILQVALVRGKLHTAIHEVIEVSLLMQAKPTDQYWRWFSDGFANAITTEILKKHTGTEDAEEFAEAYDVNKYKKLEKEINLRYWMGLNFCIKTPLEYENQLRMARYAYATHEAQRLMEKHKIGCVRKILDKACEKEPRNSENFLVAIKEVTGEDMEARLARYQTFESRKEGVAKYLKLFKAAASKTDLEQTLINLLRVLELREHLYSPTSLRERQIACSILFRLGHEKAGDEGIQQCLKMFKQTGVPEAYKAALERFLAYHLDCNKPEKALAEAEEILKDSPEHIPALLVKMLAMDRTGKKTEAKEIAKKILSLEKDEQSTVYKAAAEILTTYPNQ